MHVFEMVVIITVVVLVAGLIKDWMKKNQTPPVDLSPIEDRLAKLEALQERVEVLEKIVTDKNYDLRSEIDNLR
ncbi:hypothetical protein FLL45_08030 [Aliikangiella marina]|uniref:Phage shock protein B n=2 Tax=Aliikangiella marina TaxID=1712262 RepID=A0A545TCF7_9GAMM|nr:hypothetical protein FLL45_08030 [Aliikangiella marina]